MKLLSFLLLIRCITALPAADVEPTPRARLSVPTSDGSACLNGSISTVVKTINSTTGALQMVHTLVGFTPWTAAGKTSPEQSIPCILDVDIGVPEGWRAQANKEGCDVNGYLRLPDTKTSVVFTADYSFASSPDSVSTSTLHFVGPMNGRFMRRADVGGKVALSSCNGDTLKTAYQVRGVGASSTSPGYVGTGLGPDETNWVITSGVEILKCS